MAEDAKALIELAVGRFLEEVPALEPIKLVVAVELRGRGDVQHFRLEMPGVKVTKTPPDDARVRVEMRREFFNVMAHGPRSQTGSRRSLTGRRRPPVRSSSSS
jgi:hypothetical protein